MSKLKNSPFAAACPPMRAVISVNPSHAIVVALIAALASVAHAQDDIALAEQRAVRAAVDRVEDSVVQITTIGGLDRLEDRQLATGPTTGLIVTGDGYIVSSAFNFIQEPASILVRLPGGDQRPAELIGRDDNRMLVLLKISAERPLQIPEAAPADEIRPGDWAIALGRTYDPEKVSVSVGVVSGLKRMHGRALQTDANVSASNYGGPLVDIHGRVLGVLVPMAPSTGGGEPSSAMAGSEFYDSGIGFATPLTHVLESLDRWKDEHDLHRGLLGVGLKNGSAYSTPAEITAVWPGSPAAKAGLKPEDTIIAAGGHPISSQNDLRFQVAPRYAGDELEITVRRGAGDDAKEFEAKILLSEKLPAFRHAFIGILPNREASKPVANEEDQESDAQAAQPQPVEAEENAEKSPLVVRAVWPDSPADEAGVEAGDRILTFEDKAIASWSELLEKLNAASPDDEITLGVSDGDEKRSLNIKLAERPTEVPPASSRGAESDAQSEAAAQPLELKELKLPEMPQTARYIAAKDAPSPPALLIWLGAVGVESAEATARQWQRSVQRDGLVLLLPEPADPAGWSNDDLEYLGRLLQTALGRFQADPRRIVIGGQGKGGQLAYAFAFAQRRVVNGVIAVDSPLPRALEVPRNTPTERLAILSIETTDSPLQQLMREDRRKVAEAGYPATQIIRGGERGDPAEWDASTLSKAVRWIDGLDCF